VGVNSGLELCDLFIGGIGVERDGGAECLEALLVNEADLGRRRMVQRVYAGS